MKSIKKIKVEDEGKIKRPGYLDDKEKDIYIKREEWLENLSVEETTQTKLNGKVTKYKLEKIIVQRGSLNDVMGIQKIWKEVK